MLKTALVRRAAEKAVNAVISNGGDTIVIMEDTDKPVVQVPTSFFVVLFLTTIALAVFWVPISYCLEHVIATLTMVEAPSSTIALSASQTQPLTKPDDEENETSAPPLPLGESTPTKPITSGIRRTIRHVTSIGGFYARWRGFGVYFVYCFLLLILNGIFSGIFFIAPWMSMLIPAVIMSPIRASLTHAIISTPSTKTTWQRLPTRAQYSQFLRALFLPSFALGWAFVLCSFTQFLLSCTLLRVGSEVTTNSAIARLLGSFAILITVITLVLLPATVAVVRVEASLLPEDEDTIVPFDRTFGGRVQPTASGVPGVLTWTTALRSFDGEARIRLIKLYIKIFAVSAGFLVAGVFVLTSVTAAFMDQDQMRHVAQKSIQAVSDLKVKM